jgi:Predicted lactoylglutathione lyase
MKPPQRQVECTIPVLTVRDLAKSSRFYTQTLGFKPGWGGGANSATCSVSRDGCSIMLSQSKTKASAVWVWIGLGDSSLFDELISKGVKVFHRTTRTPMT